MRDTEFPLEELKVKLEKVEKSIHGAFVHGCILEDYGQWSKADWEFSEVDRLQKVKKSLEEQIAQLS